MGKIKVGSQAGVEEMEQHWQVAVDAHMATNDWKKKGSKTAYKNLMAKVCTVTFFY